MKQNQKTKVDEYLKKHRGKWINFRLFRWMGISQVGSRVSELGGDANGYINEYYYNKQGQKCSFYSYMPAKKLKYTPKCDILENN